MPNNKKRKRNKKRTDSDTTHEASERTYIVAYATHETRDTLPVSQTSDISPSSSNTITPSSSLRTVNTVSSSLSAKTITLNSTPVPSGSTEIPFHYSPTKERSPTRTSPSIYSPERQSIMKYNLIQQESPTRLSPTKYNPVEYHRSTSKQSPNYSPTRQISPSGESAIKYCLTRQRSYTTQYSPTRSPTRLSEYNATGINPPKCSPTRTIGSRESPTRYSPTKHRSPNIESSTKYSFPSNRSHTIESPINCSPTRQSNPSRESPFNNTPVKQNSPSRKSPTRQRSLIREGSLSRIRLMRDRPISYKSPPSGSPIKHSPIKCRSPISRSSSKHILTRKNPTNEDCNNQNLNKRSLTTSSPTRNVSPTGESSTTQKQEKHASPNEEIISKRSSNRQNSPIGQSSTKRRSPPRDDIIRQISPSSQSPPIQKNPSRASPSRLSATSQIPTTSGTLGPLKIDSRQYGDVPKPSTTEIVHEENHTEVISYIQPLVIFDSTKIIHEKKSNKKRSKSAKQALKKKNGTFKNKKNILNSKLEKYYLKAKQSHDASARIQKDLYSDQVTRVLSRSKVLKKVLAKENLLLLVDTPKYDSITETLDVQNKEGHCSKEYILSTSTTSTLKTSHSSANVSRMTENSSEVDDVSTRNSVINTMQMKNATPYKTEILSVGVAVTYNKPPINNNFENFSDRNLFTENLTSTETIVGPSVPLTEESHFSRRNSPSHYVTSISLTNENVSEKTLIADAMSDIWANNINKLEYSAESNYTVTFNNSETIVHTENLEPERNLIASERTTKPANTSQKINNFTTTKLEIIDTLKSKGMLSSIIPSASSTKLNDNFKSIVVGNQAGDQNKIDDLINNQSDEGNQQIIKSTNIFKKYYEINDSTGINKINLPNEATIKLMIDEQQVKKTCAEESKTLNTSATFAEMWEKMVVVLDLTVKRLEDTLADKILKEIRKTFPAHEINTNQKMIDEIMGLQKRNMSSVYQNKEVYVDKSVINIDSEKSLQCNLVQNQVIDRVMLEMSMEPQIPPSLSLPAKIELYTRNRDEFHILKPPTVPRVDEVIEVAAASVSTTYTAKAMPLKKKSKIVQTLKEIIKDPMKFLLENAIVIATVPAFFLMFFLIYIFIALAIQ